MGKVNIFWFRRDLRLADNAGLYHALKGKFPVVPVFIFDKEILSKLADKTDRRVEFIHNTILTLQQQLVSIGSTLHVFYAKPSDAFQEISTIYDVHTVFTNHDYEPYARERDKTIAELLSKKKIGFKSYKDQVIFEKNEVIKKDGKPYTVFTPYSKIWITTLNTFSLQSYNCERYFDNFFKQQAQIIPGLDDLGFQKTAIPFPSKKVDDHIFKHYAEKRNFPGLHATSRLGIHLRFGTISIRQLARYAKDLSISFLNELIWRDFYHMILWHFPYIEKGKSFKPAYDHIKWRDAENEFEKWCNGQTGYPIVDAGMRELNETGFMHNRLRMITASFLCKHLLIDWRWGEAYFAEKLLDYDLAANNGGWQWASGSGCDSAPYFRIFNPYLQTKRFDPEFKYIKKWVPEFEEFKYPPPMVNHEFARKRCLEAYSEALKPN
ncbi:MAG: deoxyribodipyrimidine photo-lyase [Ferruginibacter sp.]